MSKSFELRTLYRRGHFSVPFFTNNEEDYFIIQLYKKYYTTISEWYNKKEGQRLSLSHDNIFYKLIVCFYLQFATLIWYTESFAIFNRSKLNIENTTKYILYVIFLCNNTTYPPAINFPLT